MWQRRSSILFICNTFCCRLILLSSLYIALALVCCTNPDNVHCFGIIFPNLNFVFASESRGAPLQWSWLVGSAVLTPLFQGTGKKYRILTPLFREHRILTKGSTRKKSNFDPHILAFIEFWPSQLLLHRILTPIFQWLIEYWPPFLWPQIDFDPYFLALRQHIEFWPLFFWRP